MTADPKDLLPTAELAKLAGVQPQTVSNWRRRHAADFPRPVTFTAAGRPLFSQGEFEAWLETTNRSSLGQGKPMPDSELAPGTFLRRLYRLVEEARAGSAPTEESVVVDCCSLIALSYASRSGDASLPNDKSLDGRIAAAIEADGRADLFQPIAGTIELESALGVIDAEDLAKLPAIFEQILRRAGWAVRSRSSILITEIISELVWLEDAPRSIFDPACGYGGFLIDAASPQSPEKSNHPELLGQEISSDVARIAEQRALVHGLKLNVDIRDSLADERFAGSSADIVVCDPPWGTRQGKQRGKQEEVGAVRREFNATGRFRGDFVWIDHCLQHLGPGAKGYVVLPAATLSRKGRDAVARRELLVTGVVEAIIELPRGSAEGTAVAGALWILKDSPQGLTAQDSEVLLISAQAAVADGEGDADIAPLIAQAIGSWRNDRDLPAGTDEWIKRVPALELRRGDAVLQPRYWSTSPSGVVDAEEQILKLKNAQTEFKETLRSLSTIELPELEASDSAARVDETGSWTKVWKLLEEGKLIEVQAAGNSARLKALDGTEGDLGVWSSRCVRSDAPPTRPSRFVQEDQLPVRLGARTVPGDLVIGRGNGGKLVVVEDQTGGNVVLRPVRAIRMVDWNVPAVVVRAALSAPRNQLISAESSASAGSVNLDLGALELPDHLSTGDAQRLGAVLSSLLATEADGLRLARASRTTADVLVESAGQISENQPDVESKTEEGGAL